MILSVINNQIFSLAAVEPPGIAVPSTAKGYLPLSCSISLVSSVINNQRSPHVWQLQLPVEQCNQKFECHFGGVVATAGLTLPSKARGYLLFNCSNCLASSVINSQRISLVLLLQLQ